MDPKRWKQVDELLQLALQVPADQQEHVLLSECPNDTALLQEVRSLLMAHRDAGSFLQPPSIHSANTVMQPVVSASTPTIRPIKGQKVSHYRILGELGSGGMGVVYEAEDIKLGRRVAMKFLPGEVAADRVAFERLQREARATSALDHSNICSIYELGEHDGQPFIVMQLLEGQTLRDWIDCIPQLDKGSRLERTLNLAIQMANGLEAAHQKGIIHRDIKPANIFITKRGEAKILDFGLAKVLEGQAATEMPGETINKIAAPSADGAGMHLTRTGTTMGTAYYMSPEQVRGERVDVRTDLFSLGLVIYEMATGRRAFAGETRAAVYDAILNRVPAPVRQVNPAVPAELERIINKATEKDRSRRYNSSLEVASDLQKLHRATGIVPWWRSRKWKATALTLIALAIGLGLSLQRLRRQAPSEVVSPAKARRSIAVLGFRNLSSKSDEKWISTALAEMMSTELASGQQLRIIPSENVARMRLDLALADAGGYGTETLSKIRKILDTDIIVQGSYLVSPGSALRIDMQLQEATAGDTIAAVSENGNEGQIADLVSRAGASLRNQLGIAPISPSDLEKTRSTLPADLQAARLYSEGLAKLRVFDALAARDLVVRAIALDPQHALSHSLLAEAQSALGYDAEAQIEAKKAFDFSNSLPRESQLLVEARYRELSNDFPSAIEAYRSLWKFFPDDLEYGLRVATAQTKASLPKDAGLTISQLRKLPEPSRDDPRIDMAEANVADSLGDFKRCQQFAHATAEKARQQGSRLLLAEAMRREAWALDRLGELDKAFAAYSEARDDAQAGGNLRFAASALSGMGSVLYDKGDLEGARKSYEDALAIARQVGAEKVISIVTANLGNTFYDQGKVKQARTYYEEALKINRRIDNKRGIASDLGNLANVLQVVGDLAGSTSAEEQALQAFRDVGDRRGEAVTLSTLASILLDRGELALARQKFEESSTLIQQIGFRRGQVATLLGPAAILEDQGRLQEARANTLKALALGKELNDESSIAQSQWQLAKIALDEGNPVEAEALARDAAEKFHREKSVGNGCSSNALLGRTLLAQGKLKEAQTATDIARALCQRGQDQGARFQLDIAAAEVEFKTGHTEESAHNLSSINAASLQNGYVGYELESRLLMGKVEIKSGRIVSGRARLERLENDAQHKDFILIAHKARAALVGKSN